MAVPLLFGSITPLPNWMTRFIADVNPVVVIAHRAAHLEVVAGLESACHAAEATRARVMAGRAGVPTRT